MADADVRRAADAVRNGARDRHLLFLCDFDGTLVEFNPDPAAVRLPPHRRDLLQTICGRPATTLGIVSGRKLDDVRDRVALPAPVCFAGLHGLEIQAGAEHFVHPDVKGDRDLLQRLAGTLADALHGLPGTFVENKNLSFVLHYRDAAAADSVRAVAIAENLVQPHVTAGSLRLMRGASMVEVLPNIDWHKGSAVQWILERVDADGRPVWPVYIGDDTTDEDAFRVVRGRGLAIAASSRARGADLQVDGPGEVEALLRDLVDGGW